MAEITVAIPAYKPDHLTQAIASVLAQTFYDYELLISDDCPDGSVRAVVAQFADPRIRLIEGPRQGLAPNSVHLWDHAGADLLKFVHDDDFLLPFALEALRRGLAVAPDAAYAFSHRHMVDAEGRITSTPRILKGEARQVLPGPALPEAIVRGLYNMVGEPSNVLIRRSAFADSSCLSSYCGLPIRHMIDVAFYLNAGARGPCVGVPEVHAAFRRHAGQVSSQRDAPAFTIGYIEWELFIRGSVQSGLVPAASAAQALPRLEEAYAYLEPRFPEVTPFRAGLADLRARLAVGGGELLDDLFLAKWRAAQAQAAARAPA